MLIRYIGKKTVKRDTVNDPQTTYVWEAANGFVVDVKPEHTPRLLRHEDVWEEVKEPPAEDPPVEDSAPKDPPATGPVLKGPVSKGLTSA